MPCYKVVHFNGRGYAEPTRMLLALVGQEFEDVRHSTADWPKLKADVPLQQLPYMEVDGKIIPQSRAMHGFVAREFGLNGANNEETTQIDVVLSTLEDIRVPLGRILYYEKELDEIQKISRADIFFYVVMETVEEDELKKYPKLSALMKRVAEAPKIAAYLAKRPQTPW
ncbi:glutathione S-transferase-like isoform X2 [Patiria miniata]|uniref:Glutathione transferase n=1 Tax=Patiria miniata TaxID=46514 RepID=A0A914ABI5_PATMI|nr:glutathione S-transferase-like isoform X2 [Patiria miniata]